MNSPGKLSYAPINYLLKTIQRKFGNGVKGISEFPAIGNNYRVLNFRVSKNIYEDDDICKKILEGVNDYHCRYDLKLYTAYAYIPYDVHVSRRGFLRIYTKEVGSCKFYIIKRKDEVVAGKSEQGTKE